MSQLLTFTIYFKELQLSLNQEISFNIEMKSLDRNISLSHYMKMNQQYNQSMEVQCFVKKAFLQYAEKIRKLNIVLSDGKIKKKAGFVQFDISSLLNTNLRSKDFSIKLQQCPDSNAFISFVVYVNSVESACNSNDIDVHKSMTSRALSRNENDELKKQKLENIKLQNELQKVKDQLLIVETQYSFLMKQHDKLLEDYEEKEKENSDLQYQTEQLYVLNLECIEKIKVFEKLVHELQTKKKA